MILAFEDLQWADSGLLDFIDYLLEWSAEFPIFVLTLGRPELRERRPAWEPAALGSRSSRRRSRRCSRAWRPACRRNWSRRSDARAEGIPLYAVETIRMLQDRGLLVQEGARYVVTGDISDLEVPRDAARAGRLAPRRPVGRRAVAAAGRLGARPLVHRRRGGRAQRPPEAEVTVVLDRLVAKQVLARDDDPRSPERGQYVFLQALLRTVAYGTLSRRTRKARHLAAARHLERTWPGEARDIAEVLASHYQEAIRADPDADDVAELRASARETLTAAGRAAASLALGPEAQRYFEQAAELAEDDLERAELFEQAGRALWQSGDPTGAEQALRRAIEFHERGGTSLGGSAAIALASVLRYQGRVDDARRCLTVSAQPTPRSPTPSPAPRR